MNHIRQLLVTYSKLKGETNRGRNKALGWLAVLIAIFLLFLSLRGISWNEIRQTLLQGDYGLIPVLFLWGSATDFMRAVRWRILIHGKKPIGLIGVFWALMVGYLGNLTLPGRAGEVLRSIYLSNDQDMSTSFIFATCLVERVVDLILLVLIGVLAILAVGDIPPFILGVMKLMAVLGGLALLFLILFSSFKSWFSRLVNQSPLPSKSKFIIDKFLENFSLGLFSLREPKRMVFFLTISLIIWLSDTLWYMVAGLMFNIQLDLPIAMVLIASLGLSSAIPSTPGYVGVYQFVAITVLIPFGHNQSQIITYITAVQIISLFQVSFWGGLAIFRKALNISQHN